MFLTRSTNHIAEDIHLIGISTVLKLMLTQSVRVVTFWLVFDVFRLLKAVCKLH